MTNAATLAVISRDIDLKRVMRRKRVLVAVDEGINAGVPCEVQRSVIVPVVRIALPITR